MAGQKILRYVVSVFFNYLKYFYTINSALSLIHSYARSFQIGLKLICARFNKRDPFLVSALVLLSIGLLSTDSIDIANAEMYIELSPTKGVPGSLITVSGWGFTNNTKATIIFDRYPIDEAFVNADGTFTKIITIPTDAEEGYHRIIGNDGTSAIDAILTVTPPPSITVSHGHAEVGSTIIVSGSNFGSGKIITIKFDGITVTTIPSNLLSSNTGIFSTTISVPSTSGGSHKISATDGVLVAAEVINIREPAAITLSETSGPVGRMVTITGKGFSPNTPIVIKFDSSKL